jgi:hypothetical protein
MACAGLQQAQHRLVGKGGRLEDDPQRFGGDEPPCDPAHLVVTGGEDAGQLPSGLRLLKPVPP